EAQATTFFNTYGSIFGISNTNAELSLVNTETDSLGTTHLTYQQVYQGVPVFAGLLRVHFNANNQITAVNGTFIPRINLNPTPSISAGSAATTALEAVARQKATTNLTARQNTLYVFRADLARGRPGPNYLVYEVEISDGLNIREFVFVDAHTNKIVDQISGTHEALNRRVYSGTFSVPARVWQEGDPFPYTGVFSQDINNLISGSGETYNLFFNAFGRDSFNGAGAIMHTVNNDPTIACPNANWNGVTTNYCNDVTGDDTVAHEWGHAYTEFTSNLIYQWQPGALNEAYSDIVGEIVDLINGRGLDTPGPARTNVNVCSQYSPPRKYVTVNSPAGIAGNYATAGAAFGPPLTTGGVSGDLILVNDGDDEGGTGSITDACQPLTNAAAVNGKVALIELADNSEIFGPCAQAVAVKNAQNAGAIAAILINDTDSVRQIPGSDGTITIRSGKVGNRVGNTIKAQLGSGVNITLREDNNVPENSYRWLSGEDDPA
ncbi:MAG TPA: PA domain-containing protein, partial [Anaerolineae bacterium]|nr:PA domain-containing protein [Anaerolineae bacterium]